MANFLNGAQPASYGGLNNAAQASLAANVNSSNQTLILPNITNGTYVSPVAPLAYNGNTTNWHGWAGFANNTVNGSGTWTARYGGTTPRPPEFDDSPLLDDFVAKLGNDPVALAAYVQNNIQLTNMICNPDGQVVSTSSFNWAGMDRGALGVFLEGKGSPLEQCALLIYLLRQAGYPAVFVFPPSGKQLYLSTPQMEGMAGMTLQGTAGSLGAQSDPTVTAGNLSLYPVNYPWVAVDISPPGTTGNHTWISLFPWIKDIQFTEGPDLWGSLPLYYQNPLVWMDQYLRRDGFPPGCVIVARRIPKDIFARAGR